ncbi:TIR domain-containing protein (plasmid) [Glutamicibacter bergerei]
MTTEFFSRYMLSKIAQALGTNEHITHDALSTIWMGFGDHSEISDSTKAKRAIEMVEKIAKKTQADSDFMQIINEIFYYDAKSEERREHPAFKQIENQLLRDGFVSDEQGINPPIFTGSNQQKTAEPVSPEPKVVDKKVWPEPQKTWDGSFEDVKTTPTQSKDPRKVFIVHGRDTQTKDTLEQFLRYIEVSSLDWAEARRLTNSSSPTTLEIVQAGLNNAQAVIVIFTPDDEARLKDEFHNPFDGYDERKPTGQARQNVILEAGMALGIDAKRTVLVRRGKTRDISDIAGMHWLNLNNEWNDRSMLVDALVSAGVTVSRNRNFTHAHAGLYS